jgi:hypothetical protein
MLQKQKESFSNQKFQGDVVDETSVKTPSERLSL